jgi:hypothetical protein
MKGFGGTDDRPIFSMDKAVWSADDLAALLRVSVNGAGHLTASLAKDKDSSIVVLVSSVYASLDNDAWLYVAYSFELVSSTNT